MDQVVPISSAVPYMTCPGNHEYAEGFVHYTARYNNMPASGTLPTGLTGLVGGLPNNHWFKYSVGRVLFIAVSTEAYFFYNASQAQWQWLNATLDAASKQRAVGSLDWIIVYGHRSIYCSCDSDCDSDATLVREGSWGLESLLYSYGVDMWINGHEHNFERNYAVYQSQLVTGGSGPVPGKPELVVNPKAPIYIVQGAAGNREDHEPFTRPQPKYSAFRSNTYSYSRMTFYNATHLLFETVETDNEDPKATGTVIDSMLLVQTQHGPNRA